MKRQFDLLVFDWDGTLMDSTAMIARAIQHAFVDAGLAAPSDKDARFVIGYGLTEAMQYLAPDLEIEKVHAIAEAYKVHFLAKDSDLQLYAGVEAGLQRLHAAGFTLAVATGKSRRGLDRVLASTGLAPWFSATRTADEAFSKPHPAMLEFIIDTTGASPERTLMIGDTTHDLQLAINAGTASIAMSYGAHPLADLLPLQPLAHFDDFSALTEWLLQHG